MTTQEEPASAAGGEAPNRKKKLWVLSLVPFIMVLGNSMLIPVLPKMMAVLHLTLFQAGLVVTASWISRMPIGCRHRGGGA